MSNVNYSELTGMTREWYKPLVARYFKHTEFDWITVDSDGTIMEHKEEPQIEDDKYWYSPKIDFQIGELSFDVDNWRDLKFHRSEV